LKYALANPAGILEAQLAVCKHDKDDMGNELGKGYRPLKQRPTNI
jgi:hypothetical protein